MASVNLLQRKTLISFGFAGTSGTKPGTPHSPHGFAGLLASNPYNVWVLACKIEQMVRSFTLAQEHPPTMQQRHFVKFGVFVELFPIGPHAPLLQ